MAGPGAGADIRKKVEPEPKSLLRNTSFTTTKKLTPHCWIILQCCTMTSQPRKRAGLFLWKKAWQIITTSSRQWSDIVPRGQMSFAEGRYRYLSRRLGQLWVWHIGEYLSLLLENNALLAEVDFILTDALVEILLSLDVLVDKGCNARANCLNESWKTLILQHVYFLRSVLRNWYLQGQLKICFNS